MGVQQDLVAPSGLIGIQRWNKAEKAAEEIISKFQPTIVAEGKRDAVINYLQRLLKENLDCEVFAYGSVPLKTYLPDGDIDLSAVGVSTHDLINEIASLLDREGKNNLAEFVVKDVQLIGAEVKLVKCMVQNLVVDISVNQIGGLCTLCFLEQVDRVIKKDHLFKRSIILIKAWCYFESRTLGAHVGLISTYGLETLILYIFHVFHISLDGPLSVLYKFLEYFSQFDWDNYGISLMGPVRLSELPRIVVERPPNSNDLLLEVGFLRHCSEKFSVPMRPGDVYFRKHLNIVDPLNDHNNLGRSVSQGNFFRIRSAFNYGVRKLEQILMAPEDKLSEELLSFFSNTLNMHGSGQRPDLPDNIPRSGAEKSYITRVIRTPRNSNDENGFSENEITNEEKDVSALTNKGEVTDRAGIPFYAPHLLFNYSKLVTKTENGDIVDETEKEVIEEGVNLGQSEPLDLTGDLMSHLVCLDHVRWWNNYVLALTPPMMGPPPPPPPPPILLSMIASEHDGMNGVVRHPRFHRQPPFVPNDPIRRGTMTYFPDTNRSRHGYHTSTSNATNIGTTDLTTPTEPVNRPMPPREPLLHRRLHQNPNRTRQPDGSPRPRSVSGMDRFNVQSSYHLKDEEDFPPLS